MHYSTKDLVASLFWITCAWLAPIAANGSDTAVSVTTGRISLGESTYAYMWRTDDGAPRSVVVMLAGDGASLKSDSEGNVSVVMGETRFPVVSGFVILCDSVSGSIVLVRAPEIEEAIATRDGAVREVVIQRLTSLLRRMAALEMQTRENADGA